MTQNDCTFPIFSSLQPPLFAVLVPLYSVEASAASFGDLFLSPEPAFNILLSTRWNDQATALVQAELVGYKYSLTAPRPLRTPNAIFAGAVVEEFPKQACQTLVGELRSAYALAPRARENFAAVRGTEGAKALQRLFEVVACTREAVPLMDQPRINDLRVLLAKELRYLVKHASQAWSDKLTGYYEAEAAARQALAGKFMETMKTMKEDYELRVLVRAAETSDVGIQKIFLVDVLRDFPTVLLEEDFFSPKLQNFFSSILQYPRSHVTMDRPAIEAVLQTHMQTRSASGESLTNDLFKHINDPDHYFHPGAKALFVDVLALVWNYYYEHSQGMLQLLCDRKDDAFAFLAGQILRLPEVAQSEPVGVRVDISGRTEVTDNRKSFSLDAFGFGTLMHLASWQKVKKYGNLAVIQGTCRFAFVAKPRAESAEPVDAEDSAILCTKYDATFQPPASGIFSGQFYRTTRSFSPALYRHLKTWEKLGTPGEAIEIRHLTAAMARKLRQMVEGPGSELQATWDFDLLFGRQGRSTLALGGVSSAAALAASHVTLWSLQPGEALSTVRASVEQSFDNMFYSATSSLRPLLNMELARLVARQSAGRQEDQTLTPDVKSIRDSLRVKLALERVEAAKQFSEKLKAIEEDPNKDVLSFRIQHRLIDTILSSPFFYSHDVLNAIELISSIPELSDVHLALQISVRGLVALHRLLQRSPLLALNNSVAKGLKLYKPAGSQDSLRHSFISRLNIVMRLAWQFHSRSFDNQVDLLSRNGLRMLRQELSKAALVRTERLTPTRGLYALADLPRTFDSCGFTTALILVAIAEARSVPVEYLDEAGRYFSVTCTACVNARESYVATSTGLVRVPSGIPLASLALPSIRANHHFAGLKIWEAPRASLVAPRVPRAHQVRRILGRLQSFFDTERRVSHLNAAVTEAVITHAKLPVEMSICTPMSRAFPGCLVQPVLSCDPGNQVCIEKANAITADFDDLFDRLWLEVSSARFEADSLRAETHWRMLRPVVLNLLRANSPKLTREEYELMTTSNLHFAQSVAGRDAARMLWLRLILRRPEKLNQEDFSRLILAFEEFGNGAPVPTQAIQEIATFYKNEIAAAGDSTQLGDHAEAALEAAAAKACKEFASLGIYDATDKRTVKKVLLDLYYLRKESLFEFLLGSLPGVEEFPQSLRASTTSCLLEAWRNELEFNRMINELEQLSGVSAFTPQSVRECFTAGALAVEAEFREQPAAAAPSLPAQVTGVMSSSFFLFLVFHRFKTVLEALEVFRALQRPREKDLLELPNLQALTENMRSLSSSRFRGLIRRTPGFCEFAYALVAARTRRDLYILEAPSRRGFGGRLLRIGAPSTEFFKTRASRSVSVICAPACFVVSRDSGASDVVKSVAAESQTVIRDRAALLRVILSGVFPKLDFFSRVSRKELDSAGKLLPVQNTVFIPAEDARICKEEANPLHTIFVVNELCKLTKMTKSYFLEALTVTLGIGKLNPLTWLRFWLAGNDVVFALAKEALREKIDDGGAKSLETFIKDPEWRRGVPALYEEVLLKLNNSLSSFREVAMLLRRIRPATRAMRRIVESIMGFFRSSRTEKTPDEGVTIVRQARPFKMEKVIDREAVESLPDLFFLKNWLSFSICMDNGEDGLEFSGTYRLATAIGTSLKAAQRFSTESYLMHGPIRGERTVTAAFNRMAVEYFIGVGGVHDSAKTLVEHMVTAVLHTCARVQNTEELGSFCDSARACRASQTKKGPGPADVECIMKVLQDSFSSDREPGRLQAVLNIFNSLFEELGHRVVIWSQPLNHLFTYETRVKSVADSFPIQLIVGRGGPPVAEGDLPGCGLYVVSPAFSLQNQLTMASRREQGASAPIESYSAEAIEILDRFLRNQEAAVEATRYVNQDSFEPLGFIIDRIANHPELDSATVLLPAQLPKVLGPNPENEELIMQQKEFIDEVLGARAVDTEILKNLTMRQAMQACMDTRNKCKDVHDELEKRVTAALDRCQEKADKNLAAGLKPGQRRKLLSTMEEIKRALHSHECGAASCSLTSKVEASFRAVSKFFSPSEFREMHSRIFETVTPVDRDALSGEVARALKSVTPTLTLPQWATVLDKLSEANRMQATAKQINPELVGHLMLFKRTCFEVAQRRLRDSLAVIQMTVKKNAPSWASEIEIEFEQRERSRKLIVESVLNECCSKEKFLHNGATGSAHAFMKGLRSRGLSAEWNELLSHLTDNHLSHLTWMQRAWNIDIRKMGENELGMTQSCQEQRFWKIGAAACTALFLKRMGTRGLKLARFTPVTKSALEDNKQTYEEWMDRGRNVLLAAKKTSKETIKIDQYANAEAKVWVRIAEALYVRPNASWASVRQSIIASSDRIYLSVLGRKKARRLFGAVQGLHRAVSYVEEKHFNQFGAFFVTDALMRHLREQNIFDAGNSAMTIGNIKRIRTFVEWKKKVLLLKVSTEMIRTPIPVTLIQAMAQHKHLVRQVKWLAKSKIVANVVRTSLLSMVRLALGPALARVINATNPDRAMTTSTEGKSEGTPAVLAGLLSMSVLMNNYLGMNLPALVLLLPPIISFVKSYSTKNLLESIIDKVDLPELVAHILEPFFPQVEQVVVKCIREYVTVEFLDGVIREQLSSRFKLESLALSSKIKDIAEYLVNIVRRRVPIVLTKLKHYFISPTLHYVARILKELVVSVVTTGADNVANLLLQRPHKLHPAHFQYIIRLPSLTDSVGLRDVYETVLAVFRDRTLRAINPTIHIPPELTAGLAPLEKIIAFGLFPPLHPLNPLGFPSLTERAWQTQTTNHRLIFYPTLQTGVTGFLGELRLTLTHNQREIAHVFQIKDVKGLSAAELKKSMGMFTNRMLTFEFTRHSRVPHAADVVVRSPSREVLCTLSVRFGSLFVDAIQQASLITHLNQSIPGIIKHLQSISSEGLEDVLTELARQLPGIDQPDVLLAEAAGMVERKLYSNLLQYEYLSASDWFSLDFGISVSVPRVDDPAAATGPASVELTVLVGETEVAKSFLVSVFDHQDQLAQLDDIVKRRCGVKQSLTQRLLSRLRGSGAVENTPKCMKIAKFSTDHSGRSWLTLRWKNGNGYASERFAVTPTNNPDMSKTVEQPAERPLSDENLEDLRSRIASASAQRGKSYELIHWAVFTVLFKTAVVNASYRRQRRAFRRAMSETNDSGKRVFRERDYLDSEIFRKPQATLDPSWMLRLDALIHQPKYRELVTMFGDKLHAYKEALAFALSSIPVTESDSVQSASAMITAERLGQLCPLDRPESEEKKSACEKNNGMWGSLWVTDRGSSLLNFIGQKKMKTPALFKYWPAGATDTVAKYAVGDLDEIEMYLHSRADAVTVKLVSPTVVSQQVFVQLYDNYLAGEASGRVKDVGEKYQVLKYAHINQIRLLRWYMSLARGQQEASVSAVLRNAGQAIINAVEPTSVMTAEEKYTWSSKLEAYAEQVYRDLEISFGMRELSVTLGTPTSGVTEASQPHYMVYLTTLLHRNPYADGVGFQSSLQEPTIHRGCSASPIDCPSHEVLWNHVYTTLLVMVQLAPHPEILESLLAAGDLDFSGKDDPTQPLTFNQAMKLLQYGMSIIARWKVSPEVEHYFEGKVDLPWIKRMLSLFQDDETLQALVVYTPPLFLKSTVLQNPRAILQKAAWNALIALWGFSGAFGRFALEVRSGWQKQIQGGVSYGLAMSDMDSLQMPFPVREYLETELHALFFDPERPTTPLLVLEAPGMKVIDTALLGLVPVARRTGRLPISHPLLLDLLVQVRSYLHAMRNTNGALYATEKLADATARTRFLSIIREAALKAAFMEQLRLALPQRFLWKRNQFFHIDNMAKINEDYAASGVLPPDYKSRLLDLLPTVCDSIAASSYDAALDILGIDVAPIANFREVVVHLRQVLRNAGVEVPQQLRHHPIENFITTANCGPVRQLLKSEKVEKACAELDQARAQVLGKVSFTAEFKQKVAEVEARLAERVTCGADSEDGGMLRKFWVRLMEDAMKNAGVINYWDSFLSAPETAFDHPGVEALGEGVVAATLHRLALHERAGTLTPKKEAAVFPTICQFISYVRRTTQAKPTADFCRLFPDGRPVLTRFFKQSRQNQVMRMELTSFSFTRGPTVLWIEDIGEVAKVSNTLHPPRNAAVITAFRMLGEAISTSRTPQVADNPSLRKPSELVKNLSEVTDLLLDKFRKKHSTMNKWSKQVVNAILRVVDAAIVHALTSVRRFASYSSRQIKSAREEIKVQRDLERRVSAVSRYGANRRREAVADPPPPASAVGLSNPEPGPSPPALIQRAFASSVASIAYQVVSSTLLKLHRNTPRLISSVLGTSMKDIAVLLRAKPTVSGSVKSIAMSTCVNIFDNVVLPILTKPNVLAPETLIRNLIAQLTRGIHYAIMPNIGAVEEEFRRARSQDGMLPLSTFVHGIVLAAVTQLETLMQNNKWQTEMVRLVQENIRTLNSYFIDLVKRFRLADALCGITDPLLDAIADVVEKNAETLAHVLSDLMQVDAFGLLIKFAQAELLREIRLIVDTGEIYGLFELLFSTGVVNVLTDAAKGGYYFYKREHL
ncbi:hypothetical protein BESB_049440 [Besnoitia besnoiti]|uniref:Uncharacterized protein n=1 Tax=Besnoitia besnoiti TaxID=94643 RepID=A0A2A9MMI7_BESBE|nr:hypothetical protein BESB_049440 [Besnoitia besnoiti]PFH36752.1 hypothetical protein BESB_049440 [Besnoitia besnoiti]